MEVKDVGFGEYYYGTTDINTIIPMSVPDDFKPPNKMEPWHGVAVQWFNEGIGKESILIPKPGIDKEKAIKHVSCIFNTWFLTKPQKLANVSYLLSTWFLKVVL